MSTPLTTTINFLLNGKAVQVAAEPTDLLINYLRSGEVNLTGTKLSCGEGGCGACTVLWTYYDFDRQQLVNVPINSCLRPLCSLDGTAITTIEGIAAANKPDLVQTNMVTSCASQCGYCSPGFVMTMHGLLKKTPQPSPQAIENQFAGNICRCTGFISILEAMHETGRDLRHHCALGDQPTPTAEDFRPFRSLAVAEGGYSYYRPGTVEEVLALLAANPVPAPYFEHVKLLQGNTSIGIYKQGVEDPKLLIDVSRLPNWHDLRQEDDHLVLAGGVTIQQLLEYLESLPKPCPPALRALRRHVALIAGAQVRSAASVSGSLMLAINHQRSPVPFPGDLYTVLSLLDAKIEYRLPGDDQSPRTHPVLGFPAPEDFAQGLLVTAVRIPVGASTSTSGYFVKTYRVARRTQNSHPIVNAAFRCVLNDNHTVRDISLVYGGIANIAKAMTATREYVLRHPELEWGPQLIAAVLPVLTQELEAVVQVGPDAIFPAPYLRSLALRLFYKFYVYVCRGANIPLPPGEKSAANALARPLARGRHEYVIAPYYDGSADSLSSQVSLRVGAASPAPAPVVTALAPGPALTTQAAFSVGLVKSAPTVSRELLTNEKVDFQEPGAAESAPALPTKPAAELVSQPLPELKRVKPRQTGLAQPKVEVDAKQTTDLAATHKAMNFVPVQSPIKIDACTQVNGTAKYTHDLTHSADTLFACYVYSHHRHARFGYLSSREAVSAELEQRFAGAHYLHAGSIPNPAPQDSYNPENPSLYDPIFADFNPANAPLTADGVCLGGIVTCYGMPIGLVVAATLAVAQAGATFVESQLVYQDCPEEQTYTDLEDAIAKGSIMPDSTMMKGASHRILYITRPLPDTAQRAAQESWLHSPAPTEGSVFVQGSQLTGAQAHFYMETQGALAIPREDKQMEVYSSTQNQTSVQERVANLLQQPMHNVAVGTTRLGGGFGGKELRQAYVAGAAAVAAWVLQKPVRLLLDRNTDMRMVGMRHPFRGDYAVEATPEGKIERMHLHYRSDAGISYDCSFPVMDLALLCAENTYYVEAFKAMGTVYRTNIESRTAFRSFGLVQSMLITETALEHLAFRLQMRPDHLRKQNFYLDAQAVGRLPQLTPYGSPLPYCRINQVWDSFSTRIRFEERLRKVAAFNQKNRWRKRGLSMIPLKYGISYTYRPMNQGSAYVLAYKEDGSVLLHHGGIEMGQGMNTKMAQIAAIELGLPIEMVRIATNSTAVIPNVSSTGASTGSDLNGYAVRQACQALKKQLVDFLKDFLQNPANYPDTLAMTPPITVATVNQYLTYLANPLNQDGTLIWPAIIALAAQARVSVSAQYSYASPHLGVVGPVYDPNQPNALPSNYQIQPAGSQVFYYYNYCVAASEVEVDVLTGQFEILRSDIVYDAGDSLNDNIDYGQVEGGFIQGVGCLTTEEVLYGEQGYVKTDGTWEYKPPCSKTIPQKFNVYLLKYEGTSLKTAPPKDSYGIQSSKSTGEPPLVLANSVFFAIRQAVYEARKEAGAPDWFEFTAPATVQKIQQACAVGPLLPAEPA